MATANKTTTEQFLEDFNSDLTPELKYKKLLFTLPNQIDKILDSYFNMYGLDVHIREAREVIMKYIRTIGG